MENTAKVAWLRIATILDRVLCDLGCLIQYKKFRPEGDPLPLGDPPCDEEFRDLEQARQILQQACLRVRANEASAQWGVYPAPDVRPGASKITGIAEPMDD